jgi:formylglycine-generating enzyme required for sulfatase activity
VDTGRRNSMKTGIAASRSWRPGAAAVVMALLVLAVSTPAARAADPQATNARAVQVADGTKKVDVLYDLSAVPGGGASVTAGENTSPEEITVTLPGGVTMVLVKIPPGSFLMGRYPGERGSYDREDPQHLVTLSQAFYMGKTEVTQAQWQVVMGTPMPTYCGSYWMGDTYPAYCVSWNDIAGAGGFIEKLNQYLGTTMFRLPSEAEWEYAVRGNTVTPFSFPAADTWDLSCGSFPEALSYLWWCGNNTPNGSKPVGTKGANPFGLLDMHGNLFEWVQDWYHFNYTGAPSDGSAWESPTGSGRVIRGGSWFGYAQYCRSAYRRPYGPDDRYFYIGFRLARSLDGGCPNITLSPVTLSDGTVGTAYPQTTITAAGGTPGYNFTVTAGACPPGLDLSLPGVLTGTPTTAGSYTFTITATDETSCMGSHGYSIHVIASIPGDCDDSGSVSIGEVQKAIYMFLGTLAPGCGVDCNGDGTVSIGEVQKVINGFLGLAVSC